MEKQIDQIFSIWRDNPGAGAQVLVTHKGKVIFDKCYGYANLETGTPITQDSIFYIASISKMITGMAIMMLQEQGKLHVDDVIDRMIPVQRAYNAVRNRKHEFLNRLSMGVLTVEDGSVDVDELSEEGLLPGKILVYRQGGKAPEMLDCGSVPSEFKDEEEWLNEEWK